ncbi:uncharacterized protein LOC104905007 [Beta vulgaris subsp. vulgaris]|uniref:uncharacterized protein LOC104905007 n=1 Tax=Beta vulgaris subsp. vulgaris TaxID=3555 RepID=UPI00053FC2F1|nr:uncharacterized protein LOC104905007 [Beta vulgaris subsp. vulgaris]
MNSEKQKTLKKRKNTPTKNHDEELCDHPTKYQQLDDNDSNSLLDLTLSLASNPNPITPNPSSYKPKRERRNPTRVRSKGEKIIKSNTIQAPYPWATDRRANVHTLKYLLDNGIDTISGEVQCKKCENRYSMNYDLRENFQNIAKFILNEQDQWHDRAPKQWVTYKLPTCKICMQDDSCKPLISTKKRSINWLFLLLGQLLGCCTLEQLKYFCKHTNIHRTGAKNRVLLYTYLALCKQLEPHGPFYYQSI